MTEHLPECPVAAARPGTFTSCICGRLSACEQRVRREEWMASGIYAMGRDDGYDAALDNARESVADINGKWVFGPRIYKHKALAAIDALRESND